MTLEQEIHTIGRRAREASRALARLTATQALTNATYRYIETLADLPLAEAFERAPGLREGLSIYRGGITCKVVAEAHGLDYTPFAAT